MASDELLAKTITSISTFQQLRKAIEEIKETPVFTKGTWDFPKSQLVLWYKDGDSARCLQFPTSEDAELQRLSDACQSATFGRNKQDVLDESYRLARKMDTEDFSINFGFEFYEMLNHAVRGLLGVQHDNKNFRAELYKLNVYGPGSFFKAHKDTPRADNMFGSLVIALPTPHQGGTLIVRHGEENYEFDSSSTSTSSSESTSAAVAWTAFYSQVEHEVIPVVSGYRVTLTYNLYFSTASVPPLLLPIPNPAPESPELVKLLKECLDDATFLPSGGLLGFGLKHEYPLSASSDLQTSISYLKGADSTIVKIAGHFGLKSYLRAVYDIMQAKGLEGGERVYENGKFVTKPLPDHKRWLLSEKVLDLGDRGAQQVDPYDIEEYLRDEAGTETLICRGFIEDEHSAGFYTKKKKSTTVTEREICDVGTKVVSKILKRTIITKNWETGEETSVVETPNIFEEIPKPLDNSPETAEDEDDVPAWRRDSQPKRKSKPVVVNWITVMKKNNPVHTSYISYGNQAEMAYLYAQINLMVEVPSFEERRQTGKSV
ncbi:hypothetical protein SISSUDRAFT_1020371 [Sistotremastrum suecicum HHB10207 ss-3]|uniref:Prolyl 4-hydroxylase alpha subunit Fe(2+) 2OG dioxygenase domain-containing protein n=1 Tax=Sistotremastrum suecicum HHB10207 ss-3 TaxID=1314776 RepID=A0A166E979_9AGAM|nr:hypothetical protein SISSUDRAFT_1020371 [Sistotremastrum suecicum HHB10207 ss-3]